MPVNFVATPQLLMNGHYLYFADAVPTLASDVAGMNLTPGDMIFIELASNVMPIWVKLVAAPSTQNPGGLWVSDRDFSNFRNMLDGGDFSVNPFQRNVPGLASSNQLTATVSNTATYFADRWFAVGAASSSITLSRQTNTTVAGFNNSHRHQRTAANTDVNPLKFGQIMETADVYRLQGQVVTFSFWAAAAANYSGGALTVQIITGTGTNQSAASLIAGTWTGQTTQLSQTQAITTTMTRYSFSVTIPATATQVAVLIQWTPTGTAGTTDAVDFMGLQLELGSCPSQFEHRDVQVELEICQRYAWVIPEPASGVVIGAGSVTSSNHETWYLATPVQMYTAPAVTVSVGSFVSNSSTAGAVAATGLAGNATHTPNVVGLNATGTGTAGQAALLQGGGGSGYIVVSADF